MSLKQITYRKCFFLYNTVYTLSTVQSMLIAFFIQTCYAPVPTVDYKNFSCIALSGFIFQFQKQYKASSWL